MSTRLCRCGLEIVSGDTCSTCAVRLEKIKPDPGFVCIYSQCMEDIRRVARQLGYAIALHGSMRRDLDLLAVPWVDDAVEAEKLVDAIADIVGGFVPTTEDGKGGWTKKRMANKPHGRRAWNICWGGMCFIDLSVMPRAQDRDIGEPPVS